MRRFLVSENLAAGAEFRLPLEESKHAIRVMRLSVGSKILLTNGRGEEAEAEILDLDLSGSLVRVLSLAEKKERRFRIELLQAAIKGNRMDWIVEKATELGVDAIHVIDSQFSVGGDRLQRWERLAHAALKQSGNLKMPEIFESVPLLEALARIPADSCKFLLSLEGHKGLAEEIQSNLPQGEARVFLAIGPEGGFSADEEKIFAENGFKPCLLSSNILRGETAAVSALSVALHALEFGQRSGL